MIDEKLKTKHIAKYRSLITTTSKTLISDQLSIFDMTLQNFHHAEGSEFFRL